MAGYRVNRFKDLLKAIGIVLLISTISIIIYDIYINIEVENYKDMSDTKQQTIAQKMTQNLEIEKTSSDISDIIEKVSQTVVGISKLEDNGFSIFSSNSAEELGLGTGVIVSDNGYILTNQHVSGGKYSNCYVTTSEGDEFNANVIWADEGLDLSIVKVNKNGLIYANLGDSDKIKVGQRVYAIGNPIGFEFQRTVTSRNN